SAAAARAVPGVEVVSDVRAGEGRAFKSRIDVTGVTPDVSKVIATRWQAGGPQTPAQLGPDGTFVSKDYAKEHHLRVGSRLLLEVPSGATAPLTIRGIFKPPSGGGSPYGAVTISTGRFDQLYSNPQNLYTFIDMRGGVTPANTKVLGSALRGFPDAKVAPRSEFKKNQLQGLNELL